MKTVKGSVNGRVVTARFAYDGQGLTHGGDEYRVQVFNHRGRLCSERLGTMAKLEAYVAEHYGC